VPDTRYKTPGINKNYKAEMPALGPPGGGTGDILDSSCRSGSYSAARNFLNFPERKRA